MSFSKLIDPLRCTLRCSLQRLGDLNKPCGSICRLIRQPFVYRFFHRIGGGIRTSVFLLWPTVPKLWTRKELWAQGGIRRAGHGAINRKRFFADAGGLVQTRLVLRFRTAPNADDLPGLQINRSGDLTHRDLAKHIDDIDHLGPLGRRFEDEHQVSETRWQKT